METPVEMVRRAAAFEGNHECGGMLHAKGATIYLRQERETRREFTSCGALREEEKVPLTLGRGR